MPKQALILCYHRVADLQTNPQCLCVIPQYFSEHLDILRRDYRPMGLREFTRLFEERNLQPRSVMVTFDDGYADTLYHAKPLLDRYNIATTVFITNGHLGQQREFWWDELERLLLQPGTVPQTLSLTLNGRRHEWDFGDASEYRRQDFERLCSWNVLSGNDPSPRQRIYRALFQLIRPLPVREREQVLNALMVWGRGNTLARSTHRMLTPEELDRLSEARLVEIGAHTVNHAVLASLSEDAQRREIEGCKVVLEEMIGRPVTSFAYPYGTRSDYTDATVAIVRKAGFTSAYSHVADGVCYGTDPFQLPRILVRNWDGETFSRFMREWFGIG